jgi:hypothetical protein
MNLDPRPTARPARARPLRTVVVAAAAAPLVLGCYTAAPVGWQLAPQNKEVEVTLDPAETAPLAAALGPRARRLTGRVTARSDSALTVAVTAVTRTSGSEESWPGSEVVLPARAVELVTVRRLAAVRSALIAGALIGAGTLVGAVAGGGSTGSGGRVGVPGGRQ